MGIDRLTPREREVLELVAGGLTNGAMATALGILVKTVEGHMSVGFALEESCPPRTEV